ncbi:MAG TPA: response regulator transcription factor [Steroidobacteraceae bacterium]|jgi:DNA-binding NarL/FixJ family response regulator|nr:response regulator transcription factor [Steroidobacteraceae bacterium]
MCSPGATFTLLVVDDHAGVRQTVMALVSTEFPHFRLLEAECAEDALTLCETEQPDLIVLDITLPGMDGFEATRRIKAAWPRIVIVMHSSSDMPVYRDASLAAGAAAFVGKGRNSRTLLPIIAGLLPAGSAPASP